MKPREYCCCAIPLVNAGIYATLVEQTVLGIVVGTLSVGTPSIVGASTPSFAPWVLGIICYAAAAIQFFGFLGVSREKPSLYRKYVTFHGLLTTAAFSVAAAWAIISATQHDKAKAKCIADFFSADPATASEGDTICNIFPWVDVGIMGGLWLILAVLQIYLFVVISSYGKNQRRDHAQYDRVSDSLKPLATENIALQQSDPWDSRPSEDVPTTTRQDRNYQHLRNESSTSASDLMSLPSQEPKDGFSNPNYQIDTYGGPARDEQYPAYPNYAYNQGPAAPTPTANYYNANTTSHIERPSQVQPHPAEGSFRRKTPRIYNS